MRHNAKDSMILLIAAIFLTFTFNANPTLGGANTAEHILVEPDESEGSGDGVSGGSGTNGDRQSSDGSASASSGKIENLVQIERLSKLALTRGHIVIDPTHSIRTDEAAIDRLMDYLHTSVDRGGRRRILSGHDERDLACEKIPAHLSSLKFLCEAVSLDCLSEDDMWDLIPLEVTSFNQVVARLCPILLFRQTRPLCKSHSGSKYPLEPTKLKLVPPPREKVWLFSVLFATLSVVVSMGGLTVLPFLKKDTRKKILTLFEGLAVGGLAGSAILHLFPQGFGIVDEKYREYFWRVFLIFAGLYIFYFTERVIKIVSYNRRSESRRRHSPSLTLEEKKLELLLLGTSALNGGGIGSGPGVSGHAGGAAAGNWGATSVRARAAAAAAGRVASSFASLDHHAERANSLMTDDWDERFKVPHINSTKSQLTKCLASISQPNIHLLIRRESIALSDYATHGVHHHGHYGHSHGMYHPSGIATGMPAKQTYVQDVAGTRLDHASNAKMAIDTVAWMIVLGDAALNFIDGLSIGAAFGRNILAGISISVAVMLEEVTHRLGTFAVLIRAGMEPRQAVFWIAVGAGSLFPGLSIGIILGDEAEDAAPFIFALAGGGFLYMALVDVMKEMNSSLDNAQRKGIRSALEIFALQNAGIIIAIIFLSLLALHEQEMDFELVELKELQGNALPEDLGENVHD